MKRVIVFAVLEYATCCVVVANATATPTQGAYVSIGGTSTKRAYRAYMDSVPQGEPNYAYHRLSMQRDKTCNSFYLAAGYEWFDNLYIAAEAQYLLSRSREYSFMPKNEDRVVLTPCDVNAVEQSISYSNNSSLLLKIGIPYQCVTPYVVAGMHFGSFTYGVIYPYDGDEDFSICNRIFRKNIHSPTCGLGIKWETRSQFSVGAEITWKWFPKNRHYTPAMASNGGSDLDIYSYKRTYHANNPTRIHLNIYASVRLIGF